MPKLVWWVKLVAELRPGVVTETEVARIERKEQADLADLGLRLAEMKQLTAALQAEIVPAQVAVVGELRRCCSSCKRRLASKGHYPVMFRSLFGDVPVRVRRLLACPCHKHRREIAGIDRLQRHVSELLDYLERNQDVLVHYAARRRRGEPISTAFVESAVNEIVAKRMNKKQQMRWNRTTVQPFLEVRTVVLNDTLEDACRRRYSGFRPANDDEVAATAA